MRTKDDVEIDLVIERPGAPEILVEIKSTVRIQEKHAKALETLGKDTSPNAERWLLSEDPLEQVIGKTRAVHWRQALTEWFD